MWKNLLKIEYVLTLIQENYVFPRNNLSPYLTIPYYIILIFTRAAVVDAVRIHNTLEPLAITPQRKKIHK